MRAVTKLELRSQKDDANCAGSHSAQGFGMILITKSTTSRHPAASTSDEDTVAAQTARSLTGISRYAIGEPHANLRIVTPPCFRRFAATGGQRNLHYLPTRERRSALTLLHQMAIQIAV
jgi:hypothetical protein